MVVVPPSPSDVRVVAMSPEHWPDVARIFAAGIATGNATFQPAVPTWEQFDASRLPEHRWVALGAPSGEQDDEGAAVLGWVTCSPTSSREVYRGVVDASVYVDDGARGRGVGRLLLSSLIASTAVAGIWTVQSGVFPENTASLALHRSLGFRVVGTRERVGLMTHGPWAGRWRDVVLLEHRLPA
jgi:L-amino acid N-acyltransferase YncA